MEKTARCQKRKFHLKGPLMVCIYNIVLDNMKIGNLTSINKTIYAFPFAQMVKLLYQLRIRAMVCDCTIPLFQI